MPAAPPRLVILAPNWLGDAVMALPAMADLCRAWPEAHVAVAVRRGMAPLFDAVPFVHEVVPLASGGSVMERARAAEDAERLRAGGFEAALLLPNSFASAYLARQAGIPERWGYPSDFRRLLLTRTASRPSPRPHQAEYYRELIRRLGIVARPVSELRGPGFLRPSDAVIARARALLASRGWQPDAPLVGIAPGAAYGHAKRWPPDRFAGVMRALAASGVQSVAVGAAGDVEAARDIERAFTGEPPAIPWIDLVGRTDLATLIGVLSACRAVVTNDSGAMHLAAALGVPVTAMFGPTDEHATSPLPIGGDPARAHALLAKKVWCRPCMLRECPIDHRCMTRIGVEEVIEHVRRQIA